MATGKVRFFRADKGYGFIVPDHGGPDVFLHISDLTKSTGQDRINPDQRVTYETAQGKSGKGMKAVNIGLVQ